MKRTVGHTWLEDFIWYLGFKIASLLPGKGSEY